MAVARSISLLRIAALGLVAPALVGAIGPTGGFAERVLAAHNLARSEMGVPDLRWNPALAGDAQRWADRLAATGGFAHSPKGERDNVGENLWAGTRGHFTPEAMVGAWIREKQHFKPGRFPDNSTTGRSADVGHYTQLIWRETGEVGCARATGTREDVLVCRYSDAGNWIGESPL